MGKPIPETWNVWKVGAIHVREKERYTLRYMVQKFLSYGRGKVL